MRRKVINLYIILYQFYCEKRNILNKFLRKNKIDSKIHYPKPLHLHDAAKIYKYKKGQFINAEKLTKKGNLASST